MSSLRTNNKRNLINSFINAIEGQINALATLLANAQKHRPKWFTEEKRVELEKEKERLRQRKATLREDVDVS